MSSLEVQQQVDVGGCVGIITSLTDNEVKVTGVYYYGPDSKEHWSMVFDRALFEEKATLKTDTWNASFIPVKDVTQA